MKGNVHSAAKVKTKIVIRVNVCVRASLGNARQFTMLVMSKQHAKTT